MKGKIVVAGMGHGGLAAAAELAAHGYDVTVLEQKSKGTLGYDWTDIFDPEAFAAAGLPMPDQKLYTYKEDMTFVNPSMTVRLRQHVPQDKREIKMERRDLYAHLIRCAEQSGAVKYKPYALLSVTTMRKEITFSMCVRGNAEDRRIVERFFDLLEKNINALIGS